MGEDEVTVTSGLHVQESCSILKTGAEFVPTQESTPTQGQGVATVQTEVACDRRHSFSLVV